MISREKIIKGLRQHCDGSMYDRCGECPYYETDDEPFECRDALLEDAFELLKAQEPRILTLDELRALDDTVHFVWVEDNGDDDCFNGYAEVDVYKENVELFQFRNEVQWEPNNDNYGKTWRCWSSRPTDGQREATLWME